MKNSKFVGLCFVLALVVAPLNAAELKIGVVNVASVLEQAPQKAQALTRLEKEFSARKASVENRKTALLKDQEQLAKDSAILGADERKAKERAILSGTRELKRLQDEYSEDLSIRRNEELRKLDKEITQAIVDLAKKESYDLVLHQGFIAASDRIDMTAKIVEILKSK